MSSDWPFADPQNVEAITVQAVLDGAPILLVTHDADDGAWQFHTGGDTNVEDGRVVSLQSIFAADPSIGELADLPLGWHAWREAAGAPWQRVQEEAGPSALQCATCGQLHEGPVLDVGFRRPDALFRVPEDEREQRCRSTDDLCRIDDTQFFIRGMLALPLTDRDDYAAFGVWAEVSRAAFDRYYDLYDDARQGEEPPFRGELATSIPGFDETEGLAVEIRLVSPTARPSFALLDQQHALGRHQAAGISLQEWFAIYHRLGL